MFNFRQLSGCQKKALGREGRHISFKPGKQSLALFN